MPTSDDYINQSLPSGDRSQDAVNDYSSSFGQVFGGSDAVAKVSTDYGIHSFLQDAYTQRNQKYEQATGNHLPVFYAAPEVSDGDNAQPSAFMKRINDFTQEPSVVNPTSKPPSQDALEHQLAQEKVIDQYNQTLPQSQRLPSSSDLNKQALEHVNQMQEQYADTLKNAKPGFWGTDLPQFLGGVGEAMNPVEHPTFGMVNFLLGGGAGAAIESAGLKGIAALGARVGSSAANMYASSLADSYSMKELQEKTGIPFSKQEAFEQANQAALMGGGGELLGEAIGAGAKAGFKAFSKTQLAQNLFSPRETAAIADAAASKLQEVSGQDTPHGQLASQIIQNPDNAPALANNASPEAINGLFDAVDNPNTSVRAAQYGFNQEANLEAARPEDMPWDEHVQNYQRVSQKLDSLAYNVLTPDGNLVRPDDLLMNYKNSEAPNLTPEEQIQREHIQEGLLSGESTKNMNLDTMARVMQPDLFKQYDSAQRDYESAKSAFFDESAKRDEEARTNPPHQEEINQAQAKIDEILGKVHGVEEKLTKKRAAELSDLRSLLSGMKEESAQASAVDTPEMNDLKQKTVDAQQKLRDLSPQVKQTHLAAQERIGGEISEVKPAGVEKTEEPEPEEPEIPKTQSEQRSHIIDDVSRQMTEAGRNETEGRAAGEIIASFFQRMSERYGEAKGGAQDWYEREGAKIVSDIAPKKGAQGKFDPVEKVLSLFKGNADPSTIIHESGHLFLDIMDKYASQEDAPQSLKDDMSAMKDWLKVGEDGTIQTKHHEKFARAFERYVYEGVAPSRELAGVFSKFKQWMGDLVNSAKKANYRLNDNTRSFFDNMLSSNPERTVISPENEPGKLIADIHEHEAQTTTTEHADSIAKEIDLTANQHEPEVAHAIKSAELSAKTESIPSETPSNPEPVATGESNAKTKTAKQPAKVGAGGSELAAESNGAVGEPRNPTGEQPSGGSGDATSPPESKFIDKAGNIRLDNLNAPEDIKQFARDLAEQQGQFEEARGGVVTDAERRAKAEELSKSFGLSPDNFDFKQPDGVSNSVWAEVVQKMAFQGIEKAQQAAAKFAESGTLEDAATAQEAASRSAMLANYFSNITAESGRTLRVFNKQDMNFFEGMKQAAEKLEEAAGMDLFQMREEAAKLANMNREDAAKMIYMNDFGAQAKNRGGNFVLQRGMQDNRPALAISDRIRNAVILADQNAQEIRNMMPETAYRSGGGILLRNATDRLNFVKELLGMKSGDTDIAGFASEYKKAIKATVEKMNRWGGNVMNLPIEEGLSIHEDPLAYMKEGYKSWHDKVTNPESPVRFDFDKMGKNLLMDLTDPVKRDSFLKDMFDSTVREGIGDGKSDIDKVLRPFQIKFSDPVGGWTEYNKQFGISRGDPVREMNMTVRSLARNSAILQEFGPKPKATLNYMKKVAENFSARADNAHPEDQARKDTYTNQTQRDIKGLNGVNQHMESLFGSKNPPGSSLSQLAGKIYGGARNVIYGAKVIPGSFLSQTFGDRFQRSMMVRKMLDMPQTNLLKETQQYARTFFTPDQRHNFANQLGFAGATWLDSSSPRPVRDLYDITGLFPKAVADITGVNNHFEALPTLMQMEVAQHHADMADKPFNELSQLTQESFTKHGITPDDWNDYRKTPPTESEKDGFKGKMLLPVSLNDRTDLSDIRRDDLKSKFGTYILQAGQDTVPFSNAQGLNDFMHGIDPTSIGGMLLRDRTIGTHFLFSNMGLLNRAMSMRSSMGGKAKVFGSYAVSSLFAAAAILQAKSFTTYGDTRDINPMTPQGRNFWEDVFSKGTGLENILNIFGGKQSGVAGMVQGTWDMGKKQYRYQSGESTKEPNTQAAVFKSARGLVPDIWYLKPIIENGALDAVQNQVDPDAYEKWQKSDQWVKDNWGADNRFGHNFIAQ